MSNETLINGSIALLTKCLASGRKKERELANAFITRYPTGIFLVSDVISKQTFVCGFYPPKVGLDYRSKEANRLTINDCIVALFNA